MKKIFIMLLICFSTGVIFAQGIREERQAESTPRPERQRQEREMRGVEVVTINGELKLVNGFVAVQSGESTYLVPMLTRYIGFINGLQEGSTVSVEGFAMRNLLHPQKLSIEGRDYNFLPGMFAQSFPQRQNNVPNRQNQQMQRQRYNAPTCCGQMSQRFNTPQRQFTPNRNQPAPQRQFNAPNRERNNEQRRRDSEKDNERERRERPRRQSSETFDEVSIS